MRAHFPALLAALGLAGSIGCTAKIGADDVSDENEAAASSAQASRFEEAMFSPITSQEPSAAASAVAAAQWWPAGCVSRMKDASNPLVVHVHLQGCTGPFGLRQHTGDVTVVFSKNADGSLHAQATSANMTVNGKPVTYSRDADITISGDDRTVKGTGAWTRENAKGETVSHTASWTTVVNVKTKCRTTNGTAVTNVAKREIDSTMTNYQVCRKPDGSDACPSGSVSHTNKSSGKSISVTFDGSNEAQVTGPKGNTFDVPLVCD